MNLEVVVKNLNLALRKTLFKTFIIIINVMANKKWKIKDNNKKNNKINLNLLNESWKRAKYKYKQVDRLWNI